jgi:transcriptional regulator with XRE-family HTH domain
MQRIPYNAVMGNLTDQIRDAIRGSGTTMYQLAKQIGVPASTLSRFMAGKHGLALATLDKLAEVLGLQLMTTVQQAKPPAPPGRKKKGDSMTKATFKKAEWANLAKFLAEDAHENHFSSRRGVWHIEAVDVLCFYNNNPYASFPERRDQEVAEFRKRLKAAGIKELAYATYGGETCTPPVPGGYTFAMIVDAGQDRQQELVDWWHEILSESSRRMIPENGA